MKEKKTRIYKCGISGVKGINQTLISLRQRGKHVCYNTIQRNMLIDFFFKRVNFGSSSSRFEFVFSKCADIVDINAIWEKNCLVFGRNN